MFNLKLDPSQADSVDRTFKKMDQPIWIVTTQVENKKSGLTATWVHQASIDRENPTVLLGLAPNHFTCELLLQSKVCVAHLLKPHQTDLALHFSQPSSRDFDKFEIPPKLGVGPADLKIAKSETDPTRGSSEPHLQTGQNHQSVPYLQAVHSAFVCRSLHSFDAGDRIYFLCEIVETIGNSQGDFMRESDFFSQCTDEQIQRLKREMAADVAIQRPMLDTWRSGK